MAFASESIALDEFHENKLSKEGIASCLLSSYIPSSLSIFKGVEKLLPAHAMLVSPDGDIDIDRYWRVDCVAKYQSDIGASRISSSLRRAVKKQLRSDVQLGSFIGRCR